MKRWLITALLSASLVSGCGFHLRGKVDLPEQLSAIYIQQKNASPLRLAVRDALTFAGGNVVKDKSLASATLELEDTRVTRAVRTVDLRGKATSYTLTLRTVFRVLSPTNETLLPSKIASASRKLNFNSVQVLASERESGILVKEMEKDVAQQIIRNLARAGQTTTASK